MLKGMFSDGRIARGSRSFSGFGLGHFGPLYDTDNDGGGAGDGDDAGKGDGDKPADKPADKTFTQAELNTIAGNARTEARKKLLKDLGYESEAELKAAVDKQRKAEEAEQSEVEKAEREKTALQRKVDDATQLAKRALIRADIKVEAAALNIADPDAIADLVNWQGVEVDLETQAVTGVKDVLAKLQAAFKPAAGAQQDTGADKPADKPAGQVPPSPQAGEGQALNEQQKADAQQQATRSYRARF